MKILVIVLLGFVFGQVISQLCELNPSCPDHPTNKCLVGCYDVEFSVCGYIAKNCDDDNNCTIDYCSPSQGCYHWYEPEGTPCYQNCMVGWCDEWDGICMDQVLNCDDGNPCTTDECVGGTVCTNTPINGPVAGCTDGTICTNDTCVNGVCSHLPVNEDLQCENFGQCWDEICHNGTCVVTENRSNCGTYPNNQCVSWGCYPGLGEDCAVVDTRSWYGGPCGCGGTCDYDGHCLGSGYCS